MKIVYRIVTHLILFVILPVSHTGAVDIANICTFSTGLHVVKKQDFAPAVQTGYAITEGIEISAGSGIHVGIAGVVGRATPSFVDDGVVYKGFTSIGGELTAGYLHPVNFLNGFNLGLFGSARAEYARYFSTDLVFFYVSAITAPAVSVKLAGNVALRVSVPISYSFRRDLIYHVSVGLASAFLIG